MDIRIYKIYFMHLIWVEDLYMAHSSIGYTTNFLICPKWKLELYAANSTFRLIDTAPIFITSC